MNTEGSFQPWSSLTTSSWKSFTSMSLPGRPTLLCAYTDSTIWKYLQEGWDVWVASGYPRETYRQRINTIPSLHFLVTCQMKVTRLCIPGADTKHPHAKHATEIPFAYTTIGSVRAANYCSIPHQAARITTSFACRSLEHLFYHSLLLKILLSLHQESQNVRQSNHASLCP